MRSLRSGMLWTVIFTLVSLTGCGKDSDQIQSPTVTIAVAASTAEAMQEIKQEFELLYPAIECRLITGGSNGLAQQILAGNPIDLFLSANVKWANAIADKQLVDTWKEVFSNRLVLIVPRGNPATVNTLQDLSSDSVRRIAIAGKKVPAGIYADQALASAGLLNSLQAGTRLARASNVQAALAFVERGEAEAGIVYASDARKATNVEVVAELNANDYDQIRYPVLLLKASASPEAAQEFFQFLQSDQALAIFQSHGFLPLER